MKTGTKKPKFELQVYRDFIRDATSYVSLILGRKLRASEAESLGDEELTRIAILIDERADALKKTKTH